MTYERQSTAFDAMIQLLADKGLGEATTISVNETMKIGQKQRVECRPLRADVRTARLCKRLQSVDRQRLAQQAVASNSVSLRH